MVAKANTVGVTPDHKHDSPTVTIRMGWEEAVGLAARLHAASKHLRASDNPSAKEVGDTLGGLCATLTQAVAGIAAAAVVEGECPPDALIVIMPKP